MRNLIGGIKTYNAAVTPVCQPEEACAVACSCETAEGNSDCKKVHVVDACGIQCPGPILRLKKGMEELKAGEQMEIHATDAGFPRDAEAWCRTTGNRFLSSKSEGGIYKVVVEKATSLCHRGLPVRTWEEKGKTFILSVMDLDKTWLPLCWLTVRQLRARK